mmetsp:Transcript_63777/g.186538  ORF Transcript_63777/g.186538 Transcript_63777/m.186538 type:complete len:205 (+) Transcript_63777:329-943(+)
MPRSAVCHAPSRRCSQRRDWPLEAGGRLPPSGAMLGPRGMQLRHVQHQLVLVLHLSPLHLEPCHQHQLGQRCLQCHGHRPPGAAKGPLSRNWLTGSGACISRHTGKLVGGLSLDQGCRDCVHSHLWRGPLLSGRAGAGDVPRREAEARADLAQPAARGGAEHSLPHLGHAAAFVRHHFRRTAGRRLRSHVANLPAMDAELDRGL